eukprot:scaffold6483_cov186-Skeletonema_menzelii.AAC.1
MIGSRNNVRAAQGECRTYVSRVVARSARVGYRTFIQHRHLYFRYKGAIVLQMSKKVIMAAADAAKAAEDVLIFLRHWMEDEFLNLNNNNPQGRIKESIIRKTTVAYGIVELLARCYADKSLTPLQNNEEKIIRLDNFAVCISRVKAKGRQKSSSPPPSSL